MALERGLGKSYRMVQCIDILYGIRAPLQTLKKFSTLDIN